MFARLKHLVAENWMWVVFSALFCLLAVVFLMLNQPLTPDGDYHAQKFGSSPEHLLFQGGKVYRTQSGSTNIFVCNYFKSGDQWISISPDGSTYIMVATPLAVWALDPQTKMWEGPYPRSSTYWIFVAKFYVMDRLLNLQMHP